MITHPGQPLTRKRCREVWGHLLDYLPTRAEERIRACGGYKDKKRFVPYSKNLRFELGMVTYNGNGTARQMSWRRGTPFQKTKGLSLKRASKASRPTTWSKLLRGGPLFASMTTPRERWR